MRPKDIANSNMDRDEAEILAYKIVTHIVSEEDLLLRFLALTGLTADDLPTAILDTEVLAGAVDFLLSHEPDLMAFCRNAGVDPRAVTAARQLLPNPPAD